MAADQNPGREQISDFDGDDASSPSMRIRGAWRFETGRNRNDTASSSPKYITNSKVEVRIMNMRELWDTELEILDVFDSICRQHSLRYSIAYGTMLGAVRHGGFIPWDDDVDVIMPREDYETFIQIWRENPPDGFVLQNKETDWEFTQNYTKIRKDHTTFIHNEWEKHISYHTGIFIDIFPGDRAASNPLSRKLQILAAAVNLLLARNHTSKSGGPRELVEKFILSFPRRLKVGLYHNTAKYLQKWNRRRELKLFFPSTLEWAYKEYPAHLFDEITDISFEGRQYLCVKNTDRVLSLDYGHYMELPPVEQRVLKHYPIVLDTKRNLNEII